jgi:glutamyl-tRNA reductase
MALLVAGVNYKNAPLDLREALALDHRLEASYAGLRAGGSFQELVLLSTCNRVEAYALAPDGPRAEQQLREFFEALAPARAAQVRKALQADHDEAMVWHLLQVAASLDSMVLGEAQILGQVKQAYEKAVLHEAVGPVFHGLFQRVFAAAKQVRSDTEIGQRPASIPSVAVQLAERLFGELKGHRVLVLGAGDMAELCAEHLASAGAGQLQFINRSQAKARELAKRFQGGAAGLDELPQGLAQADVVVCSSGAPDFLIRPADVEKAQAERHRQPQMLIDISVPRNIDPAAGALQNVYLYNLDDLDQLAGEHREKRLAASREAEVLLKHRLRELREWLASARVLPTVKRLSQHFESVRLAEMERMRGKLAHLDAKDREKVEALTKAIVQKLLHTPLSRLKQHATKPGGASQLVEGAERLFDLDQEEPE